MKIHLRVCWWTLTDMFERFFLLGGLILMIFALASASTESSAGSDGSQISPLTNELCAEMRRHKTLTASSVVDCRRLALVKFSYFGFDGEVHHDGELVVLDAAADRVANIFEKLAKMHFPIQQAKRLDVYDGDDEASMSDNNTSAFNDRSIAGGASVSIHAYGLAIDVNPMQNPFCQNRHGALQVSPKNGEGYLNRADGRPGMVEAVVDIFAENGFPIWGGDWQNPIDYQHFQVGRDLARRLAQASSADAKAIFEMQIEQYHRCREAGMSRKVCIANTPT
jgi:D-alanyl-D-alanine carboxypeptidase